MPSAQERQSGTLKREPLKVLLEWQAAVRPFKKRTREFYTTIGAIASLLIIILLFIQEWLLIVVIIAFAFVSYVLGTVRPGQAKHEITNRGIITGESKFTWPELNRFWFSQKFGQKILHVETNIRFPRQLMLLLNETSQEKVKKLLEDYLLFEEPEKTWMDNASRWLSEKVPLES